MHLIDKHMFPQQYEFFVVNDGIDHKSSMLRSGRHGHRRHSSAVQMNPEEVKQRAATAELTSSKQSNEREELISRPNDASVPIKNDGMEGLETSVPVLKQEDDQMKGLETAMSALRFVPTSVRFGRGRGRGRGFSRA